MFVDVHAFWLAKRLSDGYEDGSYNKVYLWKWQNGEVMTMARLNYGKERKDQMAMIGRMEDETEYKIATEAVEAFMPHSLSKFHCDERFQDKKIASLLLNQRQRPDMTAKKRKWINYQADI